MTALYIINRDFEHAMSIFNPAQSLVISRNDGQLDNACLPARDQVISANTMIQLSREFYTKEYLAEIEALKAEAV